MNTKQINILKNTLLWGLALWLFGYALGIVFYGVVPKNLIGFAILPFGVAFTLWALIKRIKREELMCYFGLGLIWTVMAVLLDYIFIVKLFHSVGYYKTDVYIYYILTFILPIIVGLFKFRKVSK